MKEHELKVLLKHIISEMYNMKDDELDTYGPVNVGEKVKKMANEKTNTDGTYTDDMLDGKRDNRMSTLEGELKEETGSGAVGQAGGMISTPAWGTKNKDGSPRAIKASKSLGYKVVKSISEGCSSCKGKGKLKLRYSGGRSEMVKCPYCGSREYTDQDIKNLQAKLGITSTAIRRKKKI
jgi:hypothetical protein